jgi:hypothetical protein
MEVCGKKKNPFGGKGDPRIGKAVFCYLNKDLF